MTADLTTWRSATDATITATLDATVQACQPAGAPVADIMTPLREFAAGGKRLRALLVFASHEAHRGQRADAVAHLAAAVELFQTAALLHDDVLDGSDTRRGRPAAHRQIEAAHRGAQWEGSSQAYGTAGAILAGDLSLMAAHRACARAAESAHAKGPVVASLFATMAELVTAGQYADMRAAVQPLESLGSQRDEIVTVMRSKTASYSAQYPLMMGAALADASDARVARLSEAGVDLGVAFQLRDDVLGLTGAPEVTGKPAGDDIREGKRTLLVWHAWSHGSHATRELLRDVLGHRDASASAVAEAVDAIAASGALDAAEEEIDRLATRANVALADADLDQAGWETLRSLTDAVVRRVA
ncbi:polyprenyl synthetase family protein [Demequina globuliformis]|uniref:polyprenyl synthetase family protein n=1 Tax=Demequina globuliformis TaxID=676202 RepID=UPI00078448D8|nr:polyprenyl synthetase family protein [Demequina globuliformis]